MGMPKYSEVPLVEVLVDGEIQKLSDITEILKQFEKESEENK